jgi:hypothetical protein
MQKGVNICLGRLLDSEIAGVSCSLRTWMYRLSASGGISIDNIERAQPVIRITCHKGEQRPALRAESPYEVEEDGS